MSFDVYDTSASAGFVAATLDTIADARRVARAIARDRLKAGLFPSVGIWTHTGNVEVTGELLWHYSMAARRAAVVERRCTRREYARQFEETTS